MSRQKLLGGVVTFAMCALLSPLPAQQRISEDRDLKEYDLSGWDCLNRLGGSAKTEDGAERNQGKNRSPVSVAGMNAPSFDTAGFLRHVGPFDAQTKGKRRKEITPAQREQLQALEKQIVTLTAYLVITYAGPPESTNCGSIDLHDSAMVTEGDFARLLLADQKTVADLVRKANIPQQ